MLRRALSLSILLLLLPALLVPEPLRADEIRVAVASNFLLPAQQLAADFSAATGDQVTIISGSSGRLYAQIVNAAPFDVFLSADSERPAQLEADGHAVANSRFTYAIGQLVLWSRDPELQGRDCRAALADEFGGRLAIANPELAPYGIAAREFLQGEGLWDSVQDQLLVGENIAQTLQFVVHGGARLGFIAAAQLGVPGLPAATCSYAIPAQQHGPIVQQAVQVTDTPAAAAFMKFLGSRAARVVIESHGYRVPDNGQ